MAPDRTRVPDELVICAPMLAEYAAVRWGTRRGRRPDTALAGSAAGSAARSAADGSRLVHARVLRTGMGLARSQRAAAALLGDLAAARPRAASVVVAGLAGALRSSLSPGDVVVADEVLGGERPRAVPDAASLADGLRGAGLSVQVGPVLSTVRLACGDRADLHRRTGAIAVDMESAWLAEALTRADIPVVHGFVLRLAVVRVVVDTPAAPLLHPRTVPNGVRALRVLARVAATLPAWAAAPTAWRHAPTGV